MSLVPFNIQPLLEVKNIILIPLQEQDFEALYQTASDPKIWEQHPNKDRWKKNIFQTYFKGAMQSKGAFKIVDKLRGDIMGSTRFYDYSAEDKSIFIGYTFYATQYWGKGYNLLVKSAMLDYAFQNVSAVRFHIGSNNIRSQIAITRLGAEKVGEQEVSYFGENSILNFLYEIKRGDWKGSEFGSL